MSNKTLSQEALTGKLFQGSFARSGPIVDKLPDPIAPTAMVLCIEDMIPYENNPRKITNSKYQELKASILARGLDQPPPVTRRPGHSKYVIRNGGNTRLTILKELYAETKEERFYKIPVLFRPWDEARGEIIALTGHLAENDLQGQLMFIERAMGIEEARKIYELEVGEPVSQRELARRLAADGYPVSQSHISRMQDAVRCLLPAIPNTLYSGLGKHQVERLLSLRKCAGLTWENLPKSEARSPDFEFLFLEVLSQFDVDAAEFVYERFQDELIGNMKEGTGKTYEQVLLDINEHQGRARRTTPMENLPYYPPASINAQYPGQDSSNQAPTNVSEGQNNKSQQQPPAPNTSGLPSPAGQSKQPQKPTDQPKQQTDATPPAQPPLTDEEREARIAGHIVTPVATTQRVRDIKQKIAAMDGEILPDFNANALVSIPVQAGGLFPISDVWYIERELDFPKDLRQVAAQLAREIAEISGLGGRYVIDVQAGAGFICNEPAEDVELTDKSAHTLTLLQALSGVFAIALEQQPTEQPLELAEFKFTAALGELLFGQMSLPGQPPSTNTRLDDAAIVKLFRLIRLGRRLVELEIQQCGDAHP
jgi:ParB family protein of integrating conjugative element (PFGI_1 class)